MIILIGGEKGGTGKTTLATNLAAMRANITKDVLIIDTDKQGSASAWSATRDSHNSMERVSSIQKFGSSLPAQIKDLGSRFKDIIVDAGGRDSIELRGAMTVADEMLIPIQASQFDIWTLTAMNDLVTQAKVFNEGLKAYVILNRASTHPSVTEIEEAKLLIEDFENLYLCKTIIHDRIAYRKAAKNGLGAIELQPRELKATEEMQKIYKEIFNDQ